MVDQVTSLRKVVRKLNRDGQQVQQDLEVLRSYAKEDAGGGDGVSVGQGEVDGDDEEEEERPRLSEQLGIRSGAATIEELEVKLADIQSRVQEQMSELDGLLHDTDEHSKCLTRYTPALLRHLLGGYMNWYLRSGELISPSGVTGLWGMHFSPAGNPNYFDVHRIGEAVASATESKVIGCSILYEGQVIWNELPDCDLLCLYEYLRLQEAMAVREEARLIEADLTSLVPGEKSAAVSETATMDSSGGGGDNLDDSSKRKSTRSFPRVGRKSNSEQITELLRKKQTQIEQRAQNFRERCGFIGHAWDTVDMLTPTPDDAIASESSPCHNSGETNKE